jgi:hypothetical protein
MPLAASGLALKPATVRERAEAQSCGAAAAAEEFLLLAKAQFMGAAEVARVAVLQGQGLAVQVFMAALAVREPQAERLEREEFAAAVAAAAWMQMVALGVAGKSAFTQYGDEHEKSRDH